MESRRRLGGVLSVQNSGQPWVYAPEHGLSRASRIGLEGVRGMPDLDGRRFVVGEASRNSFELLELKRVPILSFDVQKGIVETGVAHDLAKFSEISLLDMTRAGCGDERRYNVFRETEIVVVDDCTISLEKPDSPNCWNPSKHGLQEVANSHHSTLQGGYLLCGCRPVDLLACRTPGRGGWVTLCPDVPEGKLDRLARWRQSTSIVGSTWRYHNWCYETFKFKPLPAKAPAPVFKPCNHELDILDVDFCEVEGKFLPVHPDRLEIESGWEQVHARGTSVLTFCRALGGWCIFADLWTADCHLYKLEHAASDAGLPPRPEGGLHLLYRCLGPSPLGRWEAVLGPEPAPSVRIWKPHVELPPSDGPPGYKTDSRTLDRILRFLLDFSEVDWRGYIHEQILHGLSAAEMGARLYCILDDCCQIRAVSRFYLATSSRCSTSWRGAICNLLQLKTMPRSSPGRIRTSTFPGIRLFLADILRSVASMLPEEDVAYLEQASESFANLLGAQRRALISWRRSLQSLWAAAMAFRATRNSWYTPLDVADLPHFKENAWAAAVSAVTVSTRIAGRAPWNCAECKALHRAWAACVRFAHVLLDKVPVCWDREARNNTERQSSNDGVVFETVFAGNLVSTPSALRARGQLLLVDGQLCRRDGVLVEEQASAAFYALKGATEKGVSVKFLGSRRGYCSQRLLPGGNRCHAAALVERCELFPPCDHDDRTCPVCSDTRGWSQLHSNLIFAFEFTGLPCIYEYEQRYENTEPQRTSLIVEVSLEAFVVPFLFMSTDRPLSYGEDETTEVSSINWTQVGTESMPEEEESDDLENFFEEGNQDASTADEYD